LFEKKKTKKRFFLSKVCLTCNFAEALYFHDMRHPTILAGKTYFYS